MPDLSIIIVNYRSAPLVVNCIRSVQHQTTNLAFEIIVVDNASGDKSLSVIKDLFPAVQRILMPYNAGFARANNAGIKIAKANTILLLNPDTIATDDSITRCYQQLQQSHFIAAGVQLYDSSGAPQISGNFFMAGGINHLLPIPYWGDLLRWAGYRTKTKIPNVAKASGVEEVDWVSGAFLMVKRPAIEKAGIMDEDFFLYAEEVEWCSRLKKSGPLCIFGNCSIIHLEGGSVNLDQKIEERGYYNLYNRKGLQLMVSNHLRVRKQYGVGWFLFLLLNYTWGVFFFCFCSTLHRLFTLRDPTGDWNRVAAFASNVCRLWKLTPAIISGKPHFYKML
jgi:GT2 family glycosyltransferase